MRYVIDRANVKKEQEIIKCSFIIKDNKIDYVSSHMKNINFMKMDLSQFLLTPGHVMLDFQLENQKNFMAIKQYVKDNFISKGCTTVLMTFSIEYESQLTKKLQKIKHLMINSPIDYCIGIKIPIRSLTPSLVRQCKKSKIPVIFLSLNEDEINSVAWGWIREAIYPYYPCFIPIWKESYPKNRLKRVTDDWIEVCKQAQIPTIPYLPSTGVPLSLNELKRIGIYPLKGDIRIGGDVDYNLYLKEGFEFDNLTEVNYDSDKPYITVHKGRIIKVQESFFINPGFGDEIVIKVPGYFASSFNN